ncbi:electron transfer flavoprotein FAD-binding domain protein [Clostridiales bacterium 1_7_47FAA]|uniref:FAD-binding protein n=1 Tax=Enterocloster hominis (ex Hitch et al. 2024) TaxID=1917870 RepID=A0ABV1D9V0_9FIRM|nr:electron transfer flavoprotein FAD-binding domain protein [Clostridiales bacterium 1_7_47FAA]
MTCYLILNMWAGEWERQWAGLWQAYINICSCCQSVRVIVFSGLSHELGFVQGLKVDGALILEDAFYNPENLLSEIEKNSNRNAVYIFGYGDHSHEMAVRLAFRLGGDSLTAVNRFWFEGGCILAARNVYSNNMEGTFCVKRFPFCVSLVRSTEKTAPGISGPIPDVRRKNISDNSGYVMEYSEEPVGTDCSLEDARILIALGRGVRTKEDYRKAEELARMLGAGIVASRPLVMQGIAPLERLVGASGIIAHPRLCIAAGVSGAAAFYVGIEKSGYIIAINTDPDAFIMSRADVAVERDYREVFGALRKYLIEEGMPDDFADGGKI